MKKVMYHMSDPESFFRVLGENSMGNVNGNRFQLDPGHGNGYIRFVDIQEGLWAQQMQFTPNDEIEFRISPKSVNDFYNLNFYLSNANLTHYNDNKCVEFGFDHVNILLTSSAAISRLTVPAHAELKIFNICFTRDWLMANAIGEKSKRLRKLFATDAPLYLSESLDYKSKHLLDELDLDQTNKLTLFSSVLQLLSYFFSKLRKRNLMDCAATNIHHSDLERLMKVRKTIETASNQDISLEQLSSLAGMSLSKFKRLFKQVFGITPYRYYLENRMERAMEILLRENYSVSETGFVVGYSNLSQFSKAFKNHFGVLPSQVRS